MKTVSYHPVGVVRSPILAAIDIDWMTVVSEIEVLPSYRPGMGGLEKFSHAIVVFHMDRAEFVSQTDLVRHPRGQSDLPKVGIFAQRAKHRPNPIGITVVPILGVRGKRLRVRGLDAIDGTPVLDIKPFFPPWDIPVKTKVPRWVDHLTQRDRRR